jgi:predicted RNA binding protein YcfA (HicA-like mRNA interferase family)
VSRLGGYSARQVSDVAEQLGWRHSRTAGDHFIYKKPGVAHNLSVPGHREVRAGTLAKLVKTMGITPDEFFQMVKK